MRQPHPHLRPPLRVATVRCQFGSCQRAGKARSISYYDKPGKLLTLRPRMCSEHYHDLPIVDGVVTAWLNNLRGTSR
jgi:hypothetical protein